MVQTPPKPETVTPPAAPKEWTIRQTLETLSRPLPKSLIKTKPSGKGQVEYLPWAQVQKALNKYAPGNRWRIRRIEQISDRVVVVGELTLYCADGNLITEATGSASLENYADPFASAEAMAFKRCASRLGLGLGLKD